MNRLTWQPFFATILENTIRAFPHDPQIPLFQTKGAMHFSLFPSNQKKFIQIHNPEWLEKAIIYKVTPIVYDTNAMLETCRVMRS